MQTRKWTDKDGVDKYTTEIVLQNFNSNLQMLGSKGGNKEQDQNKSIEETARDQFEGSKVVELDDSIPF